MKLAVAAHSTDSEALVPKIEGFFEELAACARPTVLVGGYWGLMKRVVDAALRRGLAVVALLPIEREDVELPEGVVGIRTGCEYRCRSVMLIRSADVVAAFGGAAGTMIEVFMGYAMGKPVFVLTNTGLASDNLRKAFPDYIDERRTASVRYFEDPREMAREICRSRAGGKVVEVG
ncbi:MAG: LOG family protein [Thermoproteus sp.]